MPSSPWRFLRASQRIAPRQRLRDCSRFPAAPARLVEVYHAPGKASGRLAGLARCGDVWCCPRCAPYEGRERGEKLAAVLRKAAGAGLYCYVVTLTVRHDRAQPLARVYDQLTRARRHFFQSRAWRQLARRAGFRGTIRAAEVTHGEHGWHCHTHEVWTFDRLPDDLVAVTMSAWQAAAHAAGTYAHPVHGALLKEVDPDLSEKLARYCTAWGPGGEVTGGHVKQAADGHRTPWDLLRAAIAGDPYARARWDEYATTMAGRQRMHSSPGIRALFAELEDPVPPDPTPTKDEQLIEILEADDWDRVLRAGAETDLLLAAANGRDVLREFVRNLPP